MEIFLAENAGFCFGVKRAVDMAEEKVQAGNLHTWGPLIHNPQEVARLKEKGIIPINDWQEARFNNVLIRTHGVGLQIFKQGEENNFNIINGTCPYVLKLQRMAQELLKNNYQIVLLGDINHPEVQGILGWIDYKAHVVNFVNEINSLDLDNFKPIALLSQTTEPQEKYEQAFSLLKALFPKAEGFNTICLATQQRQDSAVKLAQNVDVMIVVGGFDSANTRKLTALCEQIKPTYQIERAEQLNKKWFKGVNKVGVTAGASTPQWIIEEVISVMEEINKDMEATMAELIDNDFERFNEIRPGHILTGTVVQVTNDEVLVDVGGKSEGIVSINELSHRKIEDPKSIVKVGEKIKVVVLKVENKEGNMILSKKRADQEEALERLEKVYENKEIIEAEVIDVVKGGLLVDVGIRGFIPASLIDIGYIEDLKFYVGKTFRFRIVELDLKKRNAVLSRKEVLEEEVAKIKETTWNELAEGQTRKGIIKRLTKFGAFVDIGGVDALLHVSEMGWGRVSKPEEVVNIGDEVEVFILSIDREKEKVSLSLKKLIPSPWEVIADKYNVGSIIQGKVVRIAPFGAFIEIIPGVDGLVHISQISDKRVNKVEDVLSIGQEITAKILELDNEAKKISLSIKDVAVDTEKNEAEQYITEQKEEESGVTIGDVVGKNLGTSAK